MVDMATDREKYGIIGRQSKKQYQQTELDVDRDIDKVYTCLLLRTLAPAAARTC